MKAAAASGYGVLILSDRGKDIEFNRPFDELDVSYSLAQHGRFRASIFSRAFSAESK